jgi:hypothetical protein
LECPACQNFLDYQCAQCGTRGPLGPYCPECGGKTLTPQSQIYDCHKFPIASADCASCKRHLGGRHRQGFCFSRIVYDAFVVRYCTHCGVHLDDEGF